MAKRLLRRRFVDGLLLLWRKREIVLAVLNPLSRFNFDRLRLRRFRVSEFTPRFTPQFRPHRFGARGFEVVRFGTGGFGLGSLCGLLQRSGLLCMAAGALSARQLPLTHNRLCDVAGQFARAIPEGDEEAGSGFYTVRSVSLPVYRRLRRDNHSHSVCLQQALLHLLAWKSESPWARQQAQRLLWQGGVLGEKGEFALLTLDDELRERQIVWPGLRSLLAVTGFLVRFPAGPVFSD